MRYSYYFSRKQRDEQRARDVRVIKYPGYTVHD